MDLLAETYHWIIAGAVALPRILLVFVMLPFLRATILPLMIRNGLAVSLALVVIPYVGADLARESLSLYWVFFLILKEAVLGVIIGVFVSTIFWALASAGSFIDLQRGSFSGRLFSPFIDSQAYTLGNFFVFAGGVLFFLSGAMLSVVDVIYSSYTIWPVTQLYPGLNENAILVFLDLLDKMMTYMLIIAGPVVVTMLIVEGGMAILGRFVPSLNIFMLAMPIKSAVAFLLLGTYMTFVFTFVNERILDQGGLFAYLEKVFP